MSPSSSTPSTAEGSRGSSTLTKGSSCFKSSVVIAAASTNFSLEIAWPLATIEVPVAVAAVELLI